MRHSKVGGKLSAVLGENRLNKPFLMIRFLRGATDGI
jgi:hypothetical protein